ncbi:hypothetical protein [Nesterenkonia flava]|uniref:Uncharacterized protein n=1 Tax=Nesterenkonia flava TaxID=469799 RepID=A0ABU1FXF9_9MICC|nr:hypothetical protein [Nesterenkonia flava]MDR5712942.1 hypothetical protein [Nesterenkonia flava]
MEIRSEEQAAPVADDYSALLAVTRPILVGMMHSIAEEQIAPHGDRSTMKLKHLGRVRKKSDGDLGVAFEYAVHDAVVRQEPTVSEKVQDALRLCKIKSATPQSILFAMEKSGAKQLVATQRELITTESQVMSGARGRPVKLIRHLNQLESAFRKPTTRNGLPKSIKGLWKADLFLGGSEVDNWVGTTIKSRPKALEGAPGLRVAIVPSTQGGSDRIVMDNQKNLILCPLPYDFDFMQTFYEGHMIVQALVETDFQRVKEVDLPNPVHRAVAKVYVDRREFSVSEVIDSVGKFAQPHLLDTREKNVTTESFNSSVVPTTTTAVGPRPLFG